MGWTRRTFILGAYGGALSSVINVGTPMGVRAQTSSAPVTLAERYRRVRRGAARIGVPTGGGAESVSVELPRDFRRAMPQVVELQQRLRTAREAGSTQYAKVLEVLLAETSAMLRELTAPERSREPPAVAEAAAPSFEALREEYVHLFDSCSIRPRYADEVRWYVNVMAKPANKARYDEVAAKTQVPWWFVGITHGLEASFDFEGHLHNGDPLSDRTVLVPRGHPVVWNPPNDWVSSAVDALTIKRFNNQSDWSLARTMYRWEAYNGFGTRRRGINTPYLWSFCTHYTKGKYTHDRVWNSEAVSKQCGTAVLLFALVKAGIVARP